MVGISSFIPSTPEEIIARKIGIVVWLSIAVTSGLAAVGVRWWAVSLQSKHEV